jgi:hypothetical protein
MVKKEATLIFVGQLNQLQPSIRHEKQFVPPVFSVKVLAILALHSFHCEKNQVKSCQHPQTNGK